MQDSYLKKLEECLSADRLGAYGQDQPGNRTIAARYLWNIALSESLYAPLHLLEVGLRNAIDRSMVAETGSATWYDSVALTSWGQRQVGKAKSLITKNNRPVTPGRVIAELHFGFWTAMFEHHFETPAARFLPKGIKATFPHMPKSRHVRKQIKAELDTVRRLRNRVFHHERIIHLADLPQQHALIEQFLAWLNPDLAELAGLAGSFDGVYSAGIQPFLDKLDRHADADRCTPAAPSG